MSLNWSIQKCDRKLLDEKYPDLPDGTLNTVTYVIIMATVATDIGELTEKTAAEFYARVHFYERFVGSFICDGEGKSRYITPEDVKAHIGLTTNVFHTKTRAQWLKRFTVDLAEFAYAYEKA